MSDAIIGDLTFTTEDGTTLTDSTDLGLARKWAEHEHGDDWAGLTFGEQNVEISHALKALRASFEEAGR